MRVRFTNQGKPLPEQGYAEELFPRKDKVVRFDASSGKPLESVSNGGIRQIIAARLDGYKIRLIGLY